MKHLLFVALLLCAGCSGRSAPSWDTVMKLHDGQTYAQVVEIMGKPDGMDGHQFDTKYCVRMAWAWGPHTSKTIGVDDGVNVNLVNGLVTDIFVKGIDPPKEYRPPSDPRLTP